MIVQIDLDLFTPTERRLLEVLQDGKSHDPNNLAVTIDEVATRDTLRTHIASIRRVLRPLGMDIVCEYRNRRGLYRWVRLLHNPYRG